MNMMVPEFVRKRAPLTRIEPTATHEQEWNKVRTAMFWSAPGFTFIFYKLLNPSKGKHICVFTKDISVAATDGFELFFNPDTYLGKDYTIQNRVFIAGHEIMHNVLNHPALFNLLRSRKRVDYPGGKWLPWIEDVGQIAADYLINDLLYVGRVGHMPSDAQHKPELVTRNDTFAEAYRKTYEDMKEQIEKAKRDGKGNPGGNGGQPQPGSLQGKGKAFDTVLPPGAGQGKDPNEAAAERNGKEGQWRVVVAAAKAQGTMHGELERFLDRHLEPQVPWNEKITGLLARKVGSGSYDYRRPDRRFISRDIYIPSRSGFGCETIVFAGDTSGSMGQRELDLFYAECRGMVELLKPRRIIVLWCDSRVHKVQEVEDYGDIDTLKPKGGGGTAFEPVFQWIAENDVRPDALVYLTDLFGSFPKAPPAYPVIWARTTKQPFPWGDAVDVTVKQ